MKEFSFIKKGHTWHIDAPAFLDNGGKEADLEIEKYNPQFLELISEGREKVCLMIDENQFDGSDTLVFEEVANKSLGGAYYRLKTLNGKMIDKRVWLKDLLLLLFEDVPETVHFKICRKLKPLII